MLPIEESDFWNTLLIERAPVYHKAHNVIPSATPNDILIWGEMKYRTEHQMTAAESELLSDDGAKTMIGKVMRDYILRHLGLSDEEIEKLKDGCSNDYELSPGEMLDEGMLK